ncbi:hypothetical protein MOQ72_11410 [Saccharopolyspora sp. K220]|uniref:DUF7144 family membrane protein n=1 Tax=Saccharopolyspora soli TaxID=2926618 RepID=UPI001F5AA82C|nr:hypothetical protein [Saccharopolyspora soli]MCI2418033.1 hypothetical protein [Saccharopolyspora soli]
MSSPPTGPGYEEKAETAETKAPEEQKQWAMAPAQPTAGTSGWLAFAGSLILLVGVFDIISGLTSLFRPDYFLVAAGELLIFNFTTWGWIWLALGVVQAAVGVGCMLGQVWARVAGIVLAALCAIGHIAFLAAFPVWSLLVIALSVLVIYALIVPAKTASA